MDFRQLPNYFPSRTIEDCSESAMLSRGGKCLEADPSVSQIDNFFKIRGSILSLMSRNLRRLFIVVFLNRPNKVLLIIVLIVLTRKLSLCRLLRVHWIIIQKVASLYRPLLKYRIDFTWKCNFNIRGIKLQVISHFSNMLLKKKGGLPNEEQ